MNFINSRYLQYLGLGKIVPLASLNSLCLKVTSRSGRGIVSICWSNVSGSMSERIMVTRKKVELVQHLEHTYFQGDGRQCESVSELPGYASSSVSPF